MIITRHDKILISLFAALIAVAFIVGRVSKKVPEQIKPTDVTAFVRAKDSAIAVAKKCFDTIYVQRKISARQKIVVDSLILSLSQNHKKTANAVKATQNFTSDARKRYRDSVQRANGIR